MNLFEQARQKSLLASQQTSGEQTQVQCTLDVHAIDELKQSKGIQLTDDLPKYDYTSDEQGKYGKIEFDRSLVSFDNHRIDLF